MTGLTRQEEPRIWSAGYFHFFLEGYIVQRTEYTFITKANSLGKQLTHNCTYLIVCHRGVMSQCPRKQSISWIDDRLLESNQKKIDAPTMERLLCLLFYNCFFDVDPGVTLSKRLLPHSANCHAQTHHHPLMRLWCLPSPHSWMQTLGPPPCYLLKHSRDHVNYHLSLALSCRLSATVEKNRQSKQVRKDWPMSSIYIWNW